MHLPSQEGPSAMESKAETGVGTAIRRILGRAGIPSCKSCEARERALNRLFKSFRGDSSKSE